jgi:predicted RNA binding protein YcfA (HicA-like mRNA interferase family)
MGIYIRESCILSHIIDIAPFVHWPSVRAPRWEIARQLLRSASYVFFLHEQFHHKVESLGLRLLIATGTDRYRPYKTNVYRRTFLTPDCLEESLANAESYRRLSERRYVRRVEPAIRDGLRDYLKASIPLQPPGYQEGLHYFSEPPYRDGLYRLQSQTLEGVTPRTIPAGYWSVAPNMITALADITDDIYVVLPRNARPLFRPTSVDPGATVSSRALEGALMKHHGYRPVAGGKGSHVKLAKPEAPTIVLPGNQPVLSPGVVKHALRD